MTRHFYSRGSVLLGIYLSIGAVALIGSVSMNMLQGPITNMSRVTKHTVAQNNMIASGKLVLVQSVRETGDCDNDGVIEPLEWREGAGMPVPTNGGLLPATAGASLQDPWGSSYGYCAWDHGAQHSHTACGHGRRLRGDVTPSNLVIAIISAGPDRVFQSGCRAHGGGDYVLKIPGSDDIVMTYNFAEAMAASGGLWNLKQNDTNTATISKNLSVTDSSGAEQLSFNAASKSLSIGSGGTGRLPMVRTDSVQGMTDDTRVSLLSNVDMGGNRVRNLAAPLDGADAATKAYVDTKIGGGAQAVRCESFVFNGCTTGGGVTASALTKTNLGACKKACETAGVQCCQAKMKVSDGPNAMLDSCTGYGAPSRTDGALRSLLGDVLGGLLGLSDKTTLAAYCYLE